MEKLSFKWTLFQDLDQGNTLNFIQNNPVTPFSDNKMGP